MHQLVEESSRGIAPIRWLTLALVVATVGFAGLKGLTLNPAFLADYVIDGLHRAASAIIKEYQPASIFFVGPLIVILLAERLLPAKNDQATFSAGFFVDLLWFISGPIFVVFFVSKMRSYLGNVYEGHFDFLTIELLRGFPLWSQVALVILASDFLSWFSHWLRHKVKLLWHFHSIHHSQRELNAFTDHRVHPFEVLVSAMIRFLPMTLLDLRHGVALGIGWAFFTTWHTMTYHANIKTNYGWLRYILVTPQSHRVHHSVLPEHQDKNFGTILSIWDFMFGTQYRHYDEYPEVGVADRESPVANSGKPASVLRAFGSQLVYPFRLILRKGV